MAVGRNVLTRDNIIKKTRVKNQRSKEVEEEKWKRGKTQVSFWLTDNLIMRFKVKALKTKTKISTLIEETLRNHI